MDIEPLCLALSLDASALTIWLQAFPMMSTMLLFREPYAATPQDHHLYTQVYTYISEEPRLI